MLYLPWARKRGGICAEGSRDAVPRHLDRMTVQKQGLPYLVWFEERKAAASLVFTTCPSA